MVEKIHLLNDWLNQMILVCFFILLLLFVCFFYFLTDFWYISKRDYFKFLPLFLCRRTKEQVTKQDFLWFPPNSCKYWLIKYIFLYSIILVEHSISHSKAQFSLGVNCANLDSVSYCTILNINIIDIPLKCFQIKIRKIGHNISLIIILLNAVGGNWA